MPRPSTPPLSPEAEQVIAAFRQYLTSSGRVNHLLSVSLPVPLCKAQNRSSRAGCTFRQRYFTREI